MKNYLFPSLKLTVVMVVLCSLLYPLLVSIVARATPGGGDGRKVVVNGRVVGYENIGQRFTLDHYFQGRPSAVNYNAATSGGSNQSPSNEKYMHVVAARIDSFLVHNPSVQRIDIPAELVTASGSGLDPDLSPEGALVQVQRVAKARNMKVTTVTGLVKSHIAKPVFGPAHVNVLALNIALDQVAHR